MQSYNSAVFLRWLNSFRRELRLLVTGSLLLAIMAMAQGVFGVPIPKSAYMLVVGFFFLWASFNVWKVTTDSSNKEINRLQKEIEEIRHATATRESDVVAKQ